MSLTYRIFIKTKISFHQQAKHNSDFIGQSKTTEWRHSAKRMCCTGLPNVQPVTVIIQGCKMYTVSGIIQGYQMQTVNVIIQGFQMQD